MDKIIVTNKLVQNYSVLSGDYNPLHINDKFSSTSLFGQRIVHGALLLEIVLKKVLKGKIAKDLKCYFLNPAFLNDELTIRISTHKRKKIILIKNINLLVVLKIIVLISSADSKKVCLINTVGKKHPIKPLLRTKKNIKKIVNKQKNLLVYSNKRFFSLKDNLFLYLNVISREIGMNFPGKNSLFLNLQFQFNQDLNSKKNYYKILKFNNFTSTIDAEYKVGKFIGIAKSILLPEHKKKFKLKKEFLIKKKTKKNILILGGSRGLGLFTTNLLLNSNYKVNATYNLNDENLKHLKKNFSKNLKITHLNISNKSNLKKIFQSNIEYSYVFNFTTCKILKSSKFFDNAYYEKLGNFYSEPIRLFYKYKKNTHNKVKFFTPSTTYIDQNEKKLLFKEYILSKLNAERLAKKLNSKKKIFYSFRLEEYDTDQHYSFIQKKINNDIRSFVKILKKFLN
jgi:hypothetical protein